MGTDIRPEISKKNKYWIDKHRYYELKHFCAQYYSWKEAIGVLDSLAKQPEHFVQGSKGFSDPTARCVEVRERYLNWMRIVEEAASETDPAIGPYIFKAVTEGLSFEQLNAQEQVPTNKTYYYEYYRKFFYILDFKRN